jgi:hypothetical protein
VPVIFTTFPAIFGLVYGAMKHRDKAEQKEKDRDHHTEENNE